MSDVYDLLVTDQQAEVSERRIAALEEIVAARWPWSWVLKRRLRHELRASVRGYSGNFFSRRAEHTTSQWLAQRAGP
jgi:hypothetical protein